MPEMLKSMSRRKVLTGTTSVVGGIGATFAAVPFIGAWRPSEKAKAAGAPIDVDISQLQKGQLMTVAWRGMPVWVVRRTPDMLEGLSSQITELRDPNSDNSDQPEYCKNEARSVNKEYFIVVGVCTHLGCSPLYRPALGSPDVSADWKGGFFCPCHGSKFDLAGRVLKGVPAPINLVVPPYYFLTESSVRIGTDLPKENENV